MAACLPAGEPEDRGLPRVREKHLLTDDLKTPAMEVQGKQLASGGVAG